RTDRERFVSSLKAGDPIRAVQAARLLLANNSTVRDWTFVRKEKDKLLPASLRLHRFRVALLSSFSSEFIHAPLIAYGLANGMDIEIYQAGFDQFRQEILNPDSRLYSSSPDAVILSVEGRHWLPQLYVNYAESVNKNLEATI